MIPAYPALLLAIICEVIGTSFLQKSAQFTKLWPTLGVTAFYGLSFYLLSHSLRVIPLGIAYAIWSGIGVVLIAFAGWLIHGQRLDAPALIGIGLIVSGVIVMNVFSSASAH